MKRANFQGVIRPIILFLMVTCFGWIAGHGQAVRLKFTVPGQASEEVVVPMGALLVVDAGGTQYMIKPEAMHGDKVKIRSAQTSYHYDVVSRAYAMHRLGVGTNYVMPNETVKLGGTTTMDVTFNGVAAIQTRPDPKGACKGQCCTATCFSMFCCSDIHECSNTKCDCKPSGNCPKPAGSATFAINGQGNFPPMKSFVQFFNSDRMAMAYTR
jgi:hypothetical protein